MDYRLNVNTGFLNNKCVYLYNTLICSVYIDTCYKSLHLLQDIACKIIKYQWMIAFTLKINLHANDKQDLITEVSR